MHIAIIPDGNRRWAKKHSLAPWKGHLEGAKKAEEAIRAANKLGIKYLTIWGSSYDNLIKRPLSEIKILNKIYADTAERLLKSTEADGIKIRFLGEWRKMLIPKTIASLDKAEKATQNNTNTNLTILIGYNGDREILDAVNKILKNGLKDVTDQTIKENLWTHELPKVDLIIRTGGEPHLSAGFMMWDVRYSQLYFTEKLWPDFTPEDLKKAIEYYSSKERRLGA